MRRHERLIVAAGILGFALLWEALVRQGRLDASLAPAPSAIVQALVALAGRPEVLTSLGVTAWEVLAAFLVASPYALIDYASFQQGVNEQTALSQGRLDYPYVRQFADTAPYLYHIRQTLLYSVGLPLGALGIAGVAWAAARLWRHLDDDWAIVVVWIAGYFAAVGGAYMKFRNPASRFALVGVFVADFGGGKVRVGVTGAGPSAFRQADMEKALSAKFAPDAVAGIKVKADGLNNDLHASPEYRAHLIMVMCKRAVEQALK